MKTSPIGVFGYVGFLCSAEAGETTTVPLDSTGKYSLGIYYFYAGECTPVALKTGQALSTRTAGWLNTENTDYSATDGALKNTFADGTKWFCIPTEKNEVLPTLRSINLSPEESINLSEGDKILFLSGNSITDSGVIISTVKAVRITKPTKITAWSNVHALQFLG